MQNELGILHEKKQRKMKILSQKVKEKFCLLKIRQGNMS